MRVQFVTVKNVSVSASSAMAGINAMAYLLLCVLFVCSLHSHTHLLFVLWLGCGLLALPFLVAVFGYIIPFVILLSVRGRKILRPVFSVCKNYFC